MSDLNEAQSKQLAIELFNKTWQFLDMENRGDDDDEMMLQCAYASCYHWRAAGTDLNQARGEWMISHVAAVLGMAETSLHHAKRSLKICEHHGFGDFDLAFAYEAMARAAAALKDCKGHDKYLALAHAAGEQITKAEDKKVFIDGLEAGPWFGMR